MKKVEEIKEVIVLEVTEIVEQHDIETKVAEEIIDETKVNKQRNGKNVEWYSDGALVQVFPSIKACVNHFKETMELKTMPFTPIMKSIREEIVWNEKHSFKFTE
jgi:hypothetical protein